MAKWLSLPIILIIRMYQLVVSPVFPPSCRFYPTCSSYAIEALKRFGLLKGCKLALCRILKCHPWNPGGCDPVPKKRS